MPYLLLVDDDEEFADAVASVLRDKGHEVTVEHDSDGAWTCMAQRRPDAVVLDVMFPESPSAGFELARRIRRDFENLPILMLTAVNQQFPLGFSGKDIDPSWLPISEFLEKPVDMDELCKKVDRLVG